MSGTNVLKVGLLAAAGVLDTASGVYADQSAASWQGGYAGIQIGQISSGLALDYSQFGGGATSSFSTASPNPSDVAGGLFAGFNWSGTGPLVYGIEGEFNWSNAEGRADEANVTTGIPGPFNGFYRTSINETAALRGRLGYPSASGLLYVSAGLAYIQYDVAYDNAAVPSAAFRVSESQMGWTLGFGYEQDFGNQWIGRIDYRYSDFGTDILRAGSLGVQDFQYESEISTHDVRVGFARRF